MPGDAVPLALSSDARAGAASANPPQPADSRRRQQGSGRSLRPARSSLLVVGVLIVAGWLVWVFGSSLTQLNAATEQADALRAEKAALEARLEAGQRELELVQSDAFQAHQARAYGLGGEGERAFGLEADAPPPPPIVPLGGESTPTQRTPLDAWLSLLFGGP